MAKNEAKIKFTAETKSFNEAIKKSNDEMAELRAEMKLNDAQMKKTGASVEALENKHKILSNQLAASQSKTEALSQKVNKAAELFGENSTEVSKLRTQLLNAQTAEEKVRQAISVCNDELEAQRSAAREAETATQKLTSTINDQQSELSKLKSDYVEAVLQYGEASDEAKVLERSISDLSGELKQSKTALSNASDRADELDKSLDKVDDSADNAGDGFTVLKGTVADLASSAIQAAIGKISEFIGYLGELPAATMELRQNMSTLTTSFDGAKLSTEQAKNTWKELYAVFGDDAQAVEAANHISKMSDNQKDLNDWVTITTGVFGTYQDSLPVEGLAEAANETAKTGKVTGGLADALNWSSEAAEMFAGYMNDEVVTAEDAFNVALSECNTEQERQQLITDTLTKLYGGAAETYRDTAGAQMEAKEATAENMLAENDLASSIEPVTTAWTEMKTVILEELQPAIEKVSGLMTDALEWAQEHPVAMKAIAAAVGVLAVGLGGLAVAVAVYTAAQWAMNSAILANPITWVVMAVVAAIAALVAIIVVVIEYWDEIVAAVKDCCSKISEAWSSFVSWLDTNVIQPVIGFFKGLWDGIVNIFKSIINWVKDNWKSIVLFLVNPLAGVFSYLYNNFEGFRNFIDNVVKNIKEFFVDLWDGIKTVWDGICNAVQVAVMFIGSIIKAAFQIITLPWRFIWENCKEYVFAAWNWIKNAVTTAINAVKSVITTVWNAIKSVTSSVWNAIKSVISSVWNAIKSVVSSVINSVKSTISSVWNTIKSVTSSVWNAIKSVISSVWNAIKSAVSSVINSVKSTISSVWNSIKSTTSSAWNAVKNTISNVWSGIKSKVSSAINGVKSTVSGVWNSIKSTTSKVWNSVKTAMTKPIQQARDTIKGIVDKIKGFFSGLKLKLPDIKMPHFKITGSFSLDPPSVPKLGIEWYKDGGIMTRPTIFGFNGLNAMAGGEAGPEAILPIDRLEGYIEGAIEKHMNVINLESLAAAIENLANRPAVFNINDKQFAVATASAGDSVNGLRSSFKSRGLAID